MSLLSPEFQARLSALEMNLRRTLPSNLRGDRRSITRKGSSLEFADYRAYVPGDDVRHLEWKIYARLDQLVMKLYHDEEDLQVHLLVDDSASMHFGDPSKSLYARELAAALAWIALSSMHRVSVSRMSGEANTIPFTRGAAGLQRVLEFLDQPAAEAMGTFTNACEKYAARSPRGLILIISDLLERDGLEPILRRLQFAATDLAVIQVLAPQELEPDLEGDLRLLDPEGGPSVEVSLTPARLEAYRRTVTSFIAGCAELCKRRRVGFAQASTAQPIEEFVLGELLREGVLR